MERREPAGQGGRVAAGSSPAAHPDREVYERSLLQATLESTADGLLVVDQHRQVVLHNSQFRKMWAVPEDLARSTDDALLLAHVASYFDDPGEFIRRAEAIYAQPESEVFDELITRDGRVIESYSKPQWIAGRSVGRVWSIRDVTQRRQAEARLREGEARYHHLFAHVPISIWEVDHSATWRWVEGLMAEGVTDIGAYLRDRPELLRSALKLPRVLNVSDSTVAMFEANSKEELISNLSAIFTEQTYQALAASLVSIGAGQAQNSTDLLLVTLKGRPIVVRAHWSVPVREGRMDLSGLVVTFDDVTERREAAEKLQESERRYRHLFSHVPISIWEMDFTKVGEWLAELRHEGVTDMREYLAARPEASRLALGMIKVLDVNEPTLAMMETTDKAALMADPSILCTEESYRAFGNMLASMQFGNTHGTREMSVVTLKGRRLDLLVHWAMPVVGGRPDPSHVVVAGDDISERVRLQDELLKSQKLESIGTLAGGIAHDFNNLLAVVVGQASMQLRDRTLPPRLRETLKDMLHAAERGSAMTQQLLTYARGGWQRPVAVELNPVVESVMQILRRALPPQMEFTLALAEGLTPVLADPSQLEQVVMNLCLNAVQATTPPGRVEVSTEAARLDEKQARQWDVFPGEYAQLRVRDYGKGMDAAVQERIFEPFFTTRTEGRGMGLSATLGIVQSHRGHIQVESVPGKGTTMTVWLPAAPLAKGAAAGPTPRSRTSPLPRGSETLLVIDDDAAVRRTLDAMLASLGYCVVSRGEPEEALALLASNAEDFNLVVLDANLPRISLAEMYEQVRKLAPQVPVLLASGFDLQEQCAPLVAQGAAGFVQKPFSMATLAMQVRAVLDGGGKLASTEG